MTDSDWVAIAQHTQQIAFNPIDIAGVDLVMLEDALTSAGIESAFLPYRPGEGGGFTDSFRQPVQLLVKQGDAARARELAVEVLGSESDMLL